MPQPSMQHESSVRMEEDIKIDGDVLSVSHSNVCAHACVWAPVKKFEILMVVYLMKLDGFVFLISKI